MTARHTPVVMFAREVPGQAQLVVRTNPGTKVLFGFMVFAVVLEVLVFAGLVGLTVWSQSWALLGTAALWLLMAYYLTLGFREYLGLLGPQLAADHSGVWVRTGLGSRPEVVFLPWPAIDGIDVTRKGPTVRIMSRQGEGLVTKRKHWRVRSVWRRFGTPFVVDGRRSAEPPDQIAHRLHQLAQWARP
jgi:hypothetical protein